MKKEMIKYVVILVFIFGASYLSSAQQRGNNKRTLEDRIVKMDQQLDLTEDQKADLRQLFQETKEKRSGLKEQEKEERRSSMRDLKIETDNRIKEILTKEQYVKMKVLKEEHKDKRKQDVDAKIEKLEKELGLTNDQKEKVKLLFEEIKKEKSTLNKSEVSDQEKKDAKRALKAKQREGLKEILTQEQFTKMKQMKESDNHHHKRRGMME